MDRKLVVGKDGLHYCKTCGAKVERILDFPILDGTGKTEKKIVHCMCECEKAEKKAHDDRFKFEEEQRKINELWQLSLMDAKLKSVRFCTYKVTDENEKVFNIAKRYVENFDEMYEKTYGILFWGDVGTGKSYTAAAIANELIVQKKPVIMTSFIKLLDKLTNFNSKEDGKARHYATYYINKINNAKLLVIDDFGTERCTEFVIEKVYDIIDSRYRSGKPIILTTNMELGQMKNCDDIRYKRIYDRIFEMCYPVKVDGMSWRKREAVTRFDDMKKILEG